MNRSALSTIADGWRDAWRGPDRRPIYEWAKEYIRLPAAYTIQGNFNPDVSRHLLPIMDALQDDTIRRVTLMKPTRGAGTLVADIWVPWIVANDPGPIQWNMQTDPIAEDHAQGLISTCACSTRIPPRNWSALWPTTPWPSREPKGVRASFAKHSGIWRAFRLNSDQEPTSRLSHSVIAVAMKLPIHLGKRRRRLAGACGSVFATLLLRTQFELALTLGDSMAPNLCDGDLLIVQRSAYRTADPQRGDIILARYRGELIVKRVVGLPHENVELRQGTLYVNGVRIPEQHWVRPGPLEIGRGKLCSGRFALLGDNRELSDQVVVHGVVGKGDIVGKVVFNLADLIRRAKDREEQGPAATRTGPR